MLIILDVLLFCFFRPTQIGEIIGGFMAHSLAIMTDAAHLFTDIGAFLLRYKTVKKKAKVTLSPFHRTVVFVFFIDFCYLSSACLQCG